MKKITNQLVSRLLPALGLLFFCMSAQAAPTIAFERNSAIWTANLDGSNPKKLAEGNDPNISPDASQIAFDTNDSKTTPDRHIATIEISSGKMTKLQNIPSNNSFNPDWSPDNKTLLFNTFINNEWHLAVINADDTNYHLISNTKNFHAPAWASDGKSFYAHNLTSIVQFDLIGKQLKKWNIRTLIPNGSMSSSSHLNVTPNGTSLLLEADMDEALNHQTHWDGAPPALWLLDLSNDKATRVTKTGMLAWNPYWITSEEFMFLSLGENDKKPVLYRGSVKNKSYVQILKDVRSPSVSR